jgi:type II secretory pathway component GspD/PulD (secretin)
MIEVEMLEVSKGVIDQIGVQFENGINVGFSGGSRETSWPLFWNAPSERAFGSDSFAKSTITLGEVDLGSLNILLQLLHEDVSTKVLARPKILTLSGESAEIKITTDEAISVKKTEDADSGDIEFEVERSETGSSLKVTPHVNAATGEITMLVEPRIARAEATEFEFEDFTVKDIQQRATKSLVVVKEGHTLVIGGLLATRETKIRSKVPFLGDIPLIGAAFRHSDTDVEERELLIFLTPRIIRDSGDYASSASSIEPREQSRQGRQSSIDNSLARFE